MLDGLLAGFSVLIILGFCTYLILDYRKNYRNKKNYVTNKKLEYSECPNYFDLDALNKNTCVNTFKIGRCKGKYNFKDFFDENKELYFSDTIKNKTKCEWAKQCNVSWDGIDRLC